MIYIDTNVFIYRGAENDLNHENSKRLIDFIIENRLDATTSTETIQEIIHFLQRVNDLNSGIRISKLVLKQIKYLMVVDVKVINVYLMLIEKYPKADSRDVLHLACAVTSNIQIIITYDKGFKKFKEVQALTPAEYLARVV